MAVDNSDSTQYDVLKGQLADIRPIGGGGGGDRVRFVINDFMQVLYDTSCTNDATLLSRNVGRAFYDVLFDVDYTKGWNGDADVQPIPVLDISDKPAARVLNDIAHAGLGVFFVDRLGTATFYGRNHSGYTTHTIDEAQVGKQIVLSQPWDHVYNHVTAIAHRPIKKLPAVVYFLPNPEPLENGTPITIQVKYKPSTDVQLDVWDANDNKNGTGSSIKGDVNPYQFDFRIFLR